MGESSGRWGEGGPLTAAKLSGDYKTVGDSHGCSATRRGLLPVASMIRAVAHSHPQRPCGLNGRHGVQRQALGQLCPDHTNHRLFLRLPFRRARFPVAQIQNSCSSPASGRSARTTRSLRGRLPSFGELVPPRGWLVGSQWAQSSFAPKSAIGFMANRAHPMPRPSLLMRSQEI